MLLQDADTLRTERSDLCEWHNRLHTAITELLLDTVEGFHEVS